MRRETRQPVSRPGRIETDEGKTFLCRIADLSTGGALLLISNGEWLPKQFALVDIFHNTKRQARIKWVSPDRIGVAFVDGGPPKPKKPSGFGKRG